MALTSPLYRLFYRSAQTAAATCDLEVAVSKIIEISILNNRRDEVSGLLLVAQGYFIQALEGNIDVVRNTYARISMDRRHRDPHIIAQGFTERRLFGEWNMCASTLSPADKAIVDVLNAKGTFDPHYLTPDSIERLLISVAAIQRRTAVAPLSQ